jgi:hypothetical protein
MKKNFKLDKLPEIPKSNDRNLLNLYFDDSNLINAIYKKINTKKIIS